MKERPILFSGSMVRAILAGQKTQTRRAVRIDDAPITEAQWEAGDFQRGIPSNAQNVRFLAGCYLKCDSPAGSITVSSRVPCPYGIRGDRLYVKEAAWFWCERRPNGTTPTGRQKWHYVPLESASVHYATDHPERPALDVVSPDTGNQWGWRKKVARFMPRWASRITLEIIHSRAERLQDISDEDAIAEGAYTRRCDCTADGERECRPGSVCEAARSDVDWYRALWEQINGPGSWDSNPFVWVVEFKRVQP